MLKNELFIRSMKIMLGEFQQRPWEADTQKVKKIHSGGMMR